MTIGLAAYNQTATYWPAPTETGYGGIEFSNPRLIMVRWEDDVMQITDKTGSLTTSQAVVYVLEELGQDGYLCKGDQTATLDPTTLTKAFEIKRVVVIPDLRNLHEEIRVYL